MHYEFLMRTQSTCIGQEDFPNDVKWTKLQSHSRLEAITQYNIIKSRYTSKYINKDLKDSIVNIDVCNDN